MFFSYCPNCEQEELIDKVPKPYHGNLRGGWGRPIYHFSCPHCGFEGAGCMNINDWIEKDNEGTKLYVKSVIDLYEEDFK